MIAEDKNILLRILEIYLKHMQDDTERGDAITEFLYNREDNTVQMPMILSLAAEYIYNICIEEETDSSLYSKSYCVRCLSCKEVNWNECKAGWIFIYKNSNFVNITADPDKKNILKCGLTSEEYINLQKICLESVQRDCYYRLLLGVLLIRESLNRYDTDVVCYNPMKFYESIMITLFLFSFDVFYEGLKYCIKENLDTLATVYRDFLSCILELAEKEDESVKRIIFRHKSDTAQFIRCAISDALNDSDVTNISREQRTNLIKEIVKLANEFNEQMKSDKLMQLIENNEKLLLPIFGKNLLKRIKKHFNCR